MSQPLIHESDLQRPYLEHYPKQGETSHGIVLQPLPFCIGRSKTANWTVYATKVSKEHAEIFQEGDRFFIRDLGSTNGTFVNGRRIDCGPLQHGDIVHLAHKEFRFGFDGPNTPGPGTMTEPVTTHLPASRIQAKEHLRELIVQNLVQSVFQPIVDLEGHQAVAYEALGRGSHPALSSSPLELFQLADECRLAADLSRTFRAHALQQACQFPDRVLLFFNLHSSEMHDRRLLDHVQQTAACLRPDQRMVLEVHESAITDLRHLRRFRHQLQQLNIGLAFDDFGVGQTRFLELAEVPPDFIKLDRGLVSGIDRDEPRRQIVEALCGLIRQRGVRLIAEGIETAGERAVCRSLGCQLGQGYLFARPAPALHFTGAGTNAAG
jgi:EAL domain-containing protein (putative c-di-GMP-specific phosphodiesterase class I)